MSREISIGAVAERTGIKVPTIRYYEQIGLLPAPPRTESNRRLFGQDDIERLNFIRHSRELGFEVDDIRELLDMTTTPQESCHGADSIARSHLARIDRRIASLLALKGELSRMIEECGHGRVSDCRIIEALSDHSLCVSEHERA